VEQSYAGFWKRFVAALIDGILLGIVNFIILLPFLGLLGLGAVEPPHDTFGHEEVFLIAALGVYLFSMVAMTIVGWLYYALMESSNYQATLGKMALSIKVTDMGGNKVSFGKATGRYFGKIVSTFIFYVGFIMAGFTQQKQALHDIMAGCLVVNKQAVFLPPSNQPA
jgi:uncharacterized RDD family membrane protein YckC